MHFEHGKSTTHDAKMISDKMNMNPISCCPSPSSLSLAFFLDGHKAVVDVTLFLFITTFVQMFSAVLPEDKAGEYLRRSFGLTRSAVLLQVKITSRM